MEYFVNNETREILSTLTENYEIFFEIDVTEGDLFNATFAYKSCYMQFSTWIDTEAPQISKIRGQTEFLEGELESYFETQNLLLLEYEFDDRSGIYDKNLQVNMENYGSYSFQNNILKIYVNETILDPVNADLHYIYLELIDGRGNIWYDRIELSFITETTTPIFTEGSSFLDYWYLSLLLLIPVLVIIYKKKELI